MAPPRDGGAAASGVVSLAPQGDSGPEDLQENDIHAGQSCCIVDFDGCIKPFMGLNILLLLFLIKNLESLNMVRPHLCLSKRRVTRASHAVVLDKRGDWVAQLVERRTGIQRSRVRIPLVRSTRKKL